MCSSQSLWKNKIGCLRKCVSGAFKQEIKLFWLIALFVKGMKTFEQMHLSLIYEEILNTKRELKILRLKAL